jgi:hypothetical protein
MGGDKTGDSEVRKADQISGVPENALIINRSGKTIEIPANDPKSTSKLTLIPGGQLQVSLNALKVFNYEPYEERGEIELQLLEPYFNVFNKTARRIGIRSIEGHDQLIIPAFGSRRLSESVLNQYKYGPWRQRNLIEISQERAVSENGSDLKFAALGCSLMWLIAGLIITPILVRTVPLFDNWLWGIYAGVGLLGMLFGVGGTGLLRRAGESLNLLLMLIISLGVPAFVMFFFGGAELLRPTALTIPSPALLGRGLQLFFIALLASLPGLLYFQYERQQVTTLRDKFLREIMLLNPSVHTVEDAEIMYGSMVEEISGVVGASARQYFLLGAGRPIFLTTLLVTLGWLLIFLPIGAIEPAREAALYEFLAPAETAIGFTFLGTYFFALNLIFRRYARGDLTPKAYAHITVRILSSIILVWVISVVSNMVGGEGNASPVLLLVAFGVGIFPETGLVVLQDTLQKRSLKLAFSSLREQHPITRLEGVNLYDYVRLLEEGVENIENLAHYNLIELMLRSRLPTSRLVDLVDQAILYLHVWGALGEDTDNGWDRREDQALQILGSYGIRTATDLVRVVQVANEDEKEKLLRLLGPDKEDQPRRLNLILLAIQDDEWLDYLLHWRELNRSHGRVYSWEDFYSEKDMRRIVPEATDSEVVRPS